MDTNLIFETSRLGFKAKVYKDKIVFKPLFTGEQSILIGQIASIELGSFGMHNIFIETTGGKKYEIVVNSRDQNKFQDAIYQAQQLSEEKTGRMSETISGNKKKCPFCAEEIMAEAKKCRFCGEFLDKTIINDSTADDPKHQSENDLQSNQSQKINGNHNVISEKNGSIARRQQPLTTGEKQAIIALEIVLLIVFFAIGNIFFILFFSSIMCLTIESIKPSVFSYFMKGNTNPEKIKKIFGFISIILFLLFLVSLSISASNVFMLLLLLLIICLIVGLIKPSIFSHIFRNNTNRKRIFAVFGSGIGIFFFLIAFISTSGPNNQDNKTDQIIDQNNTAEKPKNHETRTNETTPISKKEPTKTKTIQPNQNTTTENQPVDLGKWFGESNVLVGKTDNGYMATFNPPLPKGSVFTPPIPDNFKGTGIYAYLIGIANYAYGDNKLSPLRPSGSQPQFVNSNGTTLIAYDAGDGTSIYFLPMKDDQTQQVIGVGVWKK